MSYVHMCIMYDIWSPTVARSGRPQQEVLLLRGVEYGVWIIKKIHDGILLAYVVFQESLRHSRTQVDNKSSYTSTTYSL
jgi:hypothetical protein